MRFRVQELKRVMREGISYTDTQIMDAERFARWCVKVCGGGYTTRQTAAAMQLQDLATRHGTAHIRDFTITRVDED